MPYESIERSLLEEELCDTTEAPEIEFQAPVTSVNTWLQRITTQKALEFHIGDATDSNVNMQALLDRRSKLEMVIQEVARSMYSSVHRLTETARECNDLKGDLENEIRVNREKLKVDTPIRSEEVRSEQLRLKQECQDEDARGKEEIQNLEAEVAEEKEAVAAKTAAVKEITEEVARLRGVIDDHIQVLEQRLEMRIPACEERHLKSDEEYVSTLESKLESLTDVKIAMSKELQFLERIAEPKREDAFDGSENAAVTLRIPSMDMHDTSEIVTKFIPIENDVCVLQDGREKVRMPRYPDTGTDILDFPSMVMMTERMI